jgi:nitrate/nitrite transporter NarK
MDVGGRFAGTFSGSMNMMGNLGGAVSPVVIGYVLKLTNDNWTPTFYLSAGVCVVGALCWILVDPVTPLDGGAAADNSLQPKVLAACK